MSVCGCSSSRTTLSSAMRWPPVCASSAMRWTGSPAAAQADAAIDSAPYDAAVLDLGLPGTDGMVWLRRWRERGSVLPVLILTARDGVRQRIAGLDAGADDYLIKPISIDELAARLRAMLRRATGPCAIRVDARRLALRHRHQAVHWKGRPVELTGRELALLEALLKHPQRVLSKAQLQEKLYDWSGRRARKQCPGSARPSAAPQDPSGHRAHGARRRLRARRGGAFVSLQRRLLIYPAVVCAGGVGRGAAGVGESGATRGQRAVRHRNHPSCAPGAGDAARPRRVRRIVAGACAALGAVTADLRDLAIAVWDARGETDADRPGRRAASSPRATWRASST